MERKLKRTSDDMTQALNNNPVPGITTPSGPSVIYKNTDTGTEFFVNPLTNQIVGVKPSNFK